MHIEEYKNQKHLLPCMLLLIFILNSLIIFTFNIYFLFIYACLIPQKSLETTLFIFMV